MLSNVTFYVIIRSLGRFLFFLFAHHTDTHRYTHTAAAIIVDHFKKDKNHTMGLNEIPIQYHQLSPTNRTKKTGIYCVLIDEMEP